MNKKIKVFVLSDMILSPSGVGTQTKYMIDALVKTGRYQFICFGGAIKHQSYDPIKIDEYGDDVIIYPVNGYGTPESIRSVLRTHKPDMLWFMTDPRFYEWLWDIENEVRPLVPMIYYHVWDNYPYPSYNKPHYESCDVVVSISKVTDDIVRTVAPNVESYHIPHAVDNDIFSKKEEAELAVFKKEHGLDEDKFIVFWNNRNARRKQSGTLALWFSEFAEEVGPENVCLIMHTDPKDLHGQDLETILNDHNYDDGRILISRNKVPPTHLSMMYNMADCTVNISDAEGFGLATLESLSCETPIIVTMTGGLQEQVTDGEEWFGIGIEPASKATIGSQEVPYIHEDRISKEDFIAALHKMYNMTAEEREELGARGTAHVNKNYNFEDFKNKWIKLMDKVVEERGSWTTRKNYSPWEIKEIA